MARCRAFVAENANGADLPSSIYVEIRIPRTLILRFMTMHFRLTGTALPLLLTSLMLLSACAGSREASGPAEPADELPTPEVRMSDYEDFDPSAYREQPPETAAGIEHDVPDKLMQGTADTGVRSTIQGYRIQVYSTLDKSTALQQEEDVKAWFRDNGDMAPPGLFSNELAVNVVYIQPYYRVRLGNFTSRDAAERARKFVTQRYSDAFIVPDTVTITR